MFGDKLGNKGIIFIIDLIVASAIIIMALIFISQIKFENTLKQQTDLVFSEAQSYLMNVPNIDTTDYNKEFVCRDYKKQYIQNKDKIIIDDKTICTNLW